MHIAIGNTSMSRLPRLAGFDYVGTHSYFLTICTRHRAELFLERALADAVVAQFRRTSRAMGFAVLAYCVMPDHVHVLVQGRRHTSDFRRFVKRVKQSTGQKYSHNAKRPLWVVFGGDPQRRRLICSPGPSRRDRARDGTRPTRYGVGRGPRSGPASTGMPRQHPM